MVRQYILDKGETHINIGWSCNTVADYLWYSLDNGGSWKKGIDIADNANGTYVISGLKANTPYNIKTRLRIKGSQTFEESQAEKVWTLNFPHCIDTPNFTLGDPVTLKFYNPLGHTFTFYIIANGTQIAQSFTCSRDEYTGLDDDTTVTQLYSTIVGERSGRYEVKVVYGESTITCDNGNTYAARYATSNHSLGAIAEDSITVNWSCDQEVDYLWHSVDGGTNWTGVDVDDGRYGTYTISGLSPNTEYKVKTRVRCKVSQRTTDSASLDVTTYDYPHCISSQNFVIGDRVTLNFYNPLGRTFTFYILANGKEYGVFSCSGTSYVGVDSATSVKKLYDMIPDKQSTKYKVRVDYGTTFRMWDGGHEYRINKQDCMPKFTDFELFDVNARVVEVTGDSHVFVKGLSAPTVRIGAPTSAVYHMETFNGATPKQYTAVLDGKHTTANYTEGIMTIIPFDEITYDGPADVVTKRVSVTAFDSRGLYAEVQKELSVYNYSKPLVNAIAKRKGFFEKGTALSISGSVSLLNINGVDKNGLTNVVYRYREKDGTWGGVHTATATINGDKFVCDDVTLILDNKKRYEIEVTVVDKLAEETVMVPVDIGQAVFFVSSNTFKCYNNGVEMPNFHTMYPVGSVYCSSTNTNPSALYGGTWELIDKAFTPSEKIVYQDPTTALSKFALTAERSGNTVRFIFDMTTKSTISAMTQLGAVSATTMAALGLVNYNGNGYFINSLLDGFAAVLDKGTIAHALFSPYGSLTMYSIFNVDGTKTIPANTNMYLEAVVICKPNQMIDSFCNRFYWKRTA